MIPPRPPADARRDFLNARVKELERIIARLRLRLKLIGDCNRDRNRCYLCAQCLHLVFDDDD